MLLKSVSVCLDVKLMLFQVSHILNSKRCLKIFYSRYFLAGSEEKLAFCKSIGADVGINYKTEDFVSRVKEETGGQGITIT